MKKRIFSILLVLAMLLSMIPVMASAETEAPEIKSAQLVLDSILSLNITVDLKENNASDYTMEVTVGESAAQILTSTTGVYTAKLMAHQMTDTIQIALKQGDTVVDSIENWTIAAYVDALGSDNAANPLATAMYNYGQYAAYYKKGGTAPSCDVSGAAVADDYKLKLNQNNTALGAVAYLYLDEACDLGFKFNAEAMTGLTLYVDGTAVTTSEVSDTQVGYRIAEILPQDYDVMHSIQVKNSEETVVYDLSYSVLSYIYLWQNRSTTQYPALVGLLNSMCLYNEEADDYQDYLKTLATITGVRWTRAIVVNRTTPQFDMNLFVELGAEDNSTVGTGVTVYINGKAYTVNITYLIESTSNKGYIQFSVQNPKGWTPVAGEDDYASDPEATFDVLIPAGTELNGKKLASDYRYVVTKPAGLTPNGTNTHVFNQNCTVEEADPEDYEIINYVNVTQFRYTRAIYMNKTTPRLDNLDFFVDAVLSETSGATVAEGVTVYVDGVAYNVNITYNTAGYITLSAIDNPGSWTPVAGEDDYASDPAVTFDLLIPEGTTFSNGYVLENAARYLITKPVGLHTTTTHPRQECTAEVADADAYERNLFTVTGVEGGTRVIAMEDGSSTRMDLYLNVDTALAEADTTVSDVSLYINGKEYINKVTYEATKQRLQISITNPIGWEPKLTDIANDPAATFDILLPEGTVLNGYALAEPARYVITKSVGLTDNGSYDQGSCSSQAADAAEYEFINYVEVTALRTAGGSSRAIVPDKTNAPDVGRLDLYFLVDVDFGDADPVDQPSAPNSTVYINGKAYTVDIYYGKVVSETTGAVAEKYIHFSISDPDIWTPVAGEDTYASDPAVTFDTLIPAGTQLGSYTLAKSARYLLSKTEGLSQDDTYPRKALTGTTANAGDYEYAFVNVTGFNYTRAIYNSTTTPQLNLEFKVDKVLADTTDSAKELYQVASGVTVYVNGQAHTVDINYNSTKQVIAITVSNPVGWTPYAGDDSYASDPEATFDVLIPAGIEFTDGNVLQNAARYIITKPVGLSLYNSVHYVNTACTGEVADASAYELVNYASITGYRNGRALYYNQEYTRLDNLCFFVDTELAKAGTVIAENALVYINGEGRLTNITYNVESGGAKYIDLDPIANVAGWTPVKGDDDYASDPTVTFDILIPAGTDLGNYKLDKSVRYIATKGGLTASGDHRLCWMSTAEAAEPYDYVYSGVVEGQYIVENGATAYAIVYPASADTQTANAASELDLRFEEATGIDIAIYKDTASIPAGTKLISIGKTAYAKSALSSTAVAEEGYRITTADSNIYVLGDGYGVLEGTYELLGELFDYEFYEAGVVAGTNTDSLDVYTLNTGMTQVPFVNIEKSAAPDITYMPTNYHGLRESDHYRYTFNNEGALVAGDSTTRWHNTFIALDPETYGSEHADWYYTKTTGILWWQDTQNIQLCYTAHGDETERQAMIDTAVAYYVALLQEYPSRSYVSFSMEDNNMWCSCDACNAAKELYGANSGAMLVMASQIRTGIMKQLADLGDTRDIKVLAMIYSSCEDLPAVASGNSYVFTDAFTAAVDAEGLEGIVPVWATMATKEHAKGWNDSANADARVMMAKFNALFDEFWVWDYGVNFHDYLLPLNTFDTLSADMQYLASQEHLKLYLYQADHTAGNTTGFGGLRTYLMSALRWDADQDIDTLTDNYFNAVYGAGADAMKEIYTDYLSMTISNESIYSDTMLTASNWPQATVESWLDLIEQAKTAAADDALALENITVESIFVRYIYAMLYTDDATFESELCNDVNKYFVLIREGASYTADTLANKL